MIRRTDQRLPRLDARWIHAQSAVPAAPDTFEGGPFDDLLALAGLACAAPFAVLHIVDQPSAFYAAEPGTEKLPTPRDWPGMPEALDAGAITTTADAPGDTRLAGHALVTGAPHIRSLVTVPLSNEAGHRIGAIGVFDTADRTESPIPVDAVLRVARSSLRQLQLCGPASGPGAEVAARPTAEPASTERRRVLDGIMAHTDAMIFAKSLDGRFILVNPAMTNSLDFPHDMVGRTDHDMFPAHEADLFRENDQRIARTGNGDVVEEVLTHPDGSVHTYRSTKFPVRDETGQVYAVAGVSVDVSELAAARQAHAEAEQRWRALVEQASIGVAVLGRGGVFRYVNRHAAALLGVGSRGWLIGRTIEEFLSDGPDAHAVPQMLDEILDGATPVSSARAWLRTGGDRVVVEFSAAGIVDRGEPAVQLEIRDITAASAAEQKLIASERRFRAVFHNSPVAMGITDGAGRWVDTNAALGQMLGVEPEELLGASGRDFAHPDDRALIDAARAREPSSDGVPPGMEIRFVRRDGEQRWAWSSISAVPGLGGEKWVPGISKDVTDRKLAEIALLESQQDLAAVAAVAKCVQSGKDPRPLIVESIRDLSAASSVVLTEALDQDNLIVTAAAGRDIVGMKLSLQDVSITAQVWHSGQRVFVADVANNSTVNPALLRANAAASALWQPVIVRGRVEAVVGVGWDHAIEDPGDRAIRVVEVIADETGISLQASRLHSELERWATTDPLTGSLNRRAWDGALQRLMELAHIKDEPLAVAILDLDHFKAYNDRHGHTAGDQRLIEFAVVARTCLRKDDVFARWGGEEFVIALPGCAPEPAVRILERILERIRADVSEGLTCSIGHTTWIPGEDLATCISRADSALYTAKNGGRNRLVTT